MVFDPFHLDPVQRVLTRNGEPVALPPQIFDLLLYFLENPNRILTKDELLQAIWPDRTVTEASLTQAVFSLRKGLQEGEGTDRFIVTSPGRGYRFVGAVREEPAPNAPSRVHEQPDLVPGVGPRSGKRTATAVLSALSVLVLTGGVWLGLERLRPHPPTVEASPAPADSIAVLPFVNLSGDPKQDYFCDGISEEILNALASIPHMTVVGRSSAFAFKGKNEDLRTIGRKLGVRQIVEGSVRREGDRVRITARLVRAEDGVQIWSQSFDRRLTDILTVQQEIAESIAGAAQRKPRSIVAGDAPTTKVAAYDLYLKAFYEGRGPGTTFDQAGRSIADLEKAVAIDPKFAAGWAELAWYYGYREQERPGAIGQPEASLAQQERTARRALELDPNSAVAYSVLAATENDRGRWAAADADYRRAAALRPNDFHTNDEYAAFLKRHGDVRNALVYMNKAHEELPLSGGAMSDFGFLLVLSDPRSAAGRVLVDSAVVTSPRHVDARRHRLILHLADGRLDEAIDDQRALDALAADAAARAFGDGIVARARDPKALKAYLQQAASRAEALDAQHMDLAPWALSIGDTDLAADLFVRSQRARIEAGDFKFMESLLSPAFAPLRKDPRIKAMLVHSGLPRYWRAHGWPSFCSPAGETDFRCS
jgi:TolB-like protein/DNA-binding winged helix-turn-helix (wHTH) protein